MKRIFIIMLTISISSFASAEVVQTIPVEGPPPVQATSTTTITTTTSPLPTPADETLVTAIYAKFSKTPALTGTALTVTSINGTVTINGTVVSQSQADAAVEAATIVAGTGNVRSNIKVTTNPDLNNQSKSPTNY